MGSAIVSRMVLATSRESTPLGTGCARRRNLSCRQEWLEKACELHRENKFRRSAYAKIFQSLKVLQPHGVLVEPFGNLGNLLERQRVSFGAQDRGLPVAFRFQNRGLLLSVCHRDLRGSVSCGRRHH